MNKSEITDALAALWVLVHEPEPIVIGSQALHGKYPDLADSIQYSREIDVILPNKWKLGNWLSDVVGDGTPFEVDRGYYIDHVLAKEGLPILADGWKERAFKEQLVVNGTVHGQSLFLSPEDMAISKLGAGREKDIEFVRTLIERGYIRLSEVQALVPCVAAAYRARVQKGVDAIHSPRETERDYSPGMSR